VIVAIRNACGLERIVSIRICGCCAVTGRISDARVETIRIELLRPRLNDIVGSVFYLNLRSAGVVCVDTLIAVCINEGSNFPN
jgi:hypothetical protein